MLGGLMKQSINYYPIQESKRDIFTLCLLNLSQTTYQMHLKLIIKINI